MFAVLLFAAVIITYFAVSQNQKSNGTNAPDTAVMAEDTIAGTYKPYKAVESETGKEAPLATVFGSAYSQYGGELTLLEDGTFTVYIGISNSDDSSGTYTRKNNKITALYKSGETAVFTVERNSEGEKTIIVPMGLYNIYFH